MTWGRFASAALLAAACVVLAPSAGDAASARVCRQLAAQLDAARGGGNPAAARKYDAAIRRQGEQMAIVRRQAREAGCGFALFGGRVRQCASLNATIDRMQANLDSLQRVRDRLGGGRSRERILAALDANGCGEDDPVETRDLPQKIGPVHRPTLLDRIFGGDAPPPPDDDYDEPPARIARGGLDGNDAGVRIRRSDGTIDEAAPDQTRQTYATMCVRTCDGYYFPMSQASTVGDFDRDEKNCQSACPGAEMQVFYRPPGSDDEAGMVSASDGRAYADLPTAYLYKRGAAPRPKSCGCNAPKNFSVIAGKAAPAQERQTPITVPLPQQQPDDAPAPQDSAVVAPDAAAPPAAGTATPQSAPEPEEENSSIVSIAAPVTPRPPPAQAAPADDKRAFDTSAEAQSGEDKASAEKKVRVVGPTFLPDPEGALDLRAPVRTQAR